MMNRKSTATSQSRRRRAMAMMKRLPRVIAFLILTLFCTTKGEAEDRNDSSVQNGSADERRDIDISAASNLRGISSPEPHLEAIQIQPQHVSKSKESAYNNNKHPSHKAFAQNMLANQGCPPTSVCGDVCYVLTVAAASDLHSVTVGTTNQPIHHWHDPASFWRMGVCNAKSQCVSVNPFDKHHNFHDLASTIADVERQCERNVGAASMFLLAKAMEPPALTCNAGVSHPDALTT